MKERKDKPTTNTPSKVWLLGVASVAAASLPPLLPPLSPTPSPDPGASPPPWRLWSLGPCYSRDPPKPPVLALLTTSIFVLIGYGVASSSTVSFASPRWPSYGRRRVSGRRTDGPSPRQMRWPSGRHPRPRVLGSARGVSDTPAA